MANNVTVTPAAAKMVYASGATDFITVSGNVSGSSSPSYGVGGLHITSDQTNSFGVFIHNKKAGGGNQYAKLELASEDANLMKYHTWDNAAGTLGAERFTQTVTETYALFEARSATNQLYLASGGNVGIGTTAPDTSLHTSGDITVQGGDIFFGNTDKLRITRGGTTYFQTLTSGGSAAGLQSLGLMVNNAYGSTPQRATITIGETGSKPTAAAGYGFVWVSGSTPNKLYFTDDAGTDFDLTAGGGGGTIGGTVSANYIPYASSADTLANFTSVYTETDNIIMGTTPASITTDADGNTSLGAGALNKITDGDKNVAVGMYAARSGTTAKHSVAVGNEAARLGITGNYNVSVGYQANYSGTKDANVIIGYQAAVDAATQSGSVAIGYRAARYPQGNYNTAIGMQALQGNASVTTANNNVAVGYQAGHDITSGVRNTLVGYQAGYDIESGLDNTLIGQQAGVNITTGPRNTIVGSYAGDALTTADGVVAIGYAALGAGAGASYDIAIGYEAHNNGTGRGVFIGLQAGKATTGGGTIIGSEAGETNTVGNLTLIGYEAGKLVSGTSNSMVAVGHGVSTNASGTYHTMVGFQAGNTLKGNVNTGVGYKVLQSGTNATHQSNIAIGYQTMQGGNYSVTNQDNVAIGINALRYASGSSYNVAIGQTLFQADQTSTQVVSVGYRALSGATATTGTTAVGHLAARDLTTGDHNVAIGRNAAYALTDGTDNTVVGYQALRSGASADGNTAIGLNALYKTTDGGENVAIGKNAGYNLEGGSNLIGSFSTFVGYGAGYGIVGGISYGSNIAIGHQTLYTGTNANRTVAIGNSAGVSGTASVDNVLVGYGAGSYANSTGNTMIGNKAGFRTNGNYNTVMGYRALSGSSSGDTSNLNVAIGYTAMEDSTSAVENVAIGSYAAGDLTTGDYNTVLGYSALRVGTTASRNTAIGYAAMNEFIEGDKRNTAVGMYAMHRTESGSHNVAMGYEAMKGVNAAMDAGGDMKDKIGAGLLGAGKGAAEAIDFLTGGLLDKLSSMTNSLGMGFNEAWEKLDFAAIGETFEYMFDSAIQAVKDLLGISSPSKVMMDIGSSMIEGITSMLDADTLIAAAQMMVDALLFPFTSLGSLLMDLVTGAFDLVPDSIKSFMGFETDSTSDTATKLAGATTGGVAAKTGATAGNNNPDPYVINLAMNLDGKEIDKKVINVVGGIAKQATL